MNNESIISTITSTGLDTSKGTEKYSNILFFQPDNEDKELFMKIEILSNIIKSNKHIDIIPIVIGDNDNLKEAMELCKSEKILFICISNTYKKEGDQFLFSQDIINNLKEEILNLSKFELNSNVDFTEVIKDGGYIYTGYGRGKNSSDFKDVTIEAFDNPITDKLNSVKLYKVLIHVTAGKSLKMESLSELESLVEKYVNEDSHICYSFSLNEEIEDEYTIVYFAVEMKEK